MNICPILYTGMVVYIGQWRPHFPTKYGSAPMWYISGNVRSTASIWCMCLKKNINNKQQQVYLKLSIAYKACAHNNISEGYSNRAQEKKKIL